MYYKVRDFKVRTNIGSFRGTLFKLRYRNLFQIRYDQISIIVDNQEYITNSPTFELALPTIDFPIANNYTRGDITFDKCIADMCSEPRIERKTFYMENCVYNFMLPSQTTIQDMVEKGNKDMCKRYEQILTVNNKIEGER